MRRYAPQLLVIVWRITKERMTRYLVAALDLFLIIIPLPDQQIFICTKLLNCFFYLAAAGYLRTSSGSQARLFYLLNDAREILVRTSA